MLGTGDSTDQIRLRQLIFVGEGRSQEVAHLLRVNGIDALPAGESLPSDGYYP